MEKILQNAALILSIINALIILYVFLRDRPRLIISAIHPEVYQNWFELPPSEFKGKPTRKWGLIAYVGIGNKGLRSVAVDEWRLWIKLRNNKKIELKPMNLPSPKIDFRSFIKEFPVLGQKGESLTGDTMIDSGDSISGMSYYIYECYGASEWDPIVTHDKIIGTFMVKDVFSKKYNATIYFSKIPKSKIEQMFGSIDSLNHC